MYLSYYRQCTHITCTNLVSNINSACKANYDMAAGTSMITTSYFQKHVRYRADIYKDHFMPLKKCSDIKSSCSF